MLEKVLSDLHRTVGSYRKKSLENPARLEKSATEHREIFNAVKAGDAERADMLASLHVGAALDNLLKMEGPE